MHGGRVFNRIEDIRLEWKFLGYTLGLFTVALLMATMIGAFILVSILPLPAAILGIILMLALLLVYIKITDTYVSPDLYYTESHAWRRYVRRCLRPVVRNY